MLADSVPSNQSHNGPNLAVYPAGGVSRRCLLANVVAGGADDDDSITN